MQSKVDQFKNATKLKLNDLKLISKGVSDRQTFAIDNVKFVSVKTFVDHKISLIDAKKSGMRKTHRQYLVSFAYSLKYCFIY